MNPIPAHPKVTLTGTYCSANKGDAAMQYVFAHEFLSLYPDAEVQIASPFPEIDQPRYPGIKVVRSLRRNLPIATAFTLLLCLLRVFRLRPRRLAFSAELNAIAQSDLIVDLSGDMITEDYGILVAWSHFLPLIQALLLGRPLYICAQSVGPFRHLRFLARHILCRATKITLREEISIGIVRDLGLPDKLIERTADLAFLLKPETDTRIAAIFDAEGIPSTRRRRLGISVSALLVNSANRNIQDASIGLHELAEEITFAAKKHALDIIVVSHVTGPKPKADDRLVANRLAELIGVPARALQGDYLPRELKGIIATCDYFIGCRMHANIAALDSGIPTLAIGYSHKFRGILRDFQLDNLVVDWQSMSTHRLREALEQLVERGQETRERLAANLPGIRNRAAANFSGLFSDTSYGCSREEE